MRGGGRTAILALAALLAGCSSSEQVDVAPASPDEQRALAEARAMIPAGELSTAPSTETPAATESAKP